MRRYLIIISILFFQVFLYSQEIKEKAEEIIRSSFTEKISFEMQKYEIPASIKNLVETEVKQRFFTGHVFIYKINSGKTLKGYAVLDNVYGKSMPITFLVIFDTLGYIINSDIVKYREQYGGGVSSKNWNEQFSGKNSGSGFSVGKDIDAITGATISVNSVTKGIKKLALLIQEIKNKL